MLHDSLLDNVQYCIGHHRLRCLNEAVLGDASSCFGTRKTVFVPQVLYFFDLEYECFGRFYFSSVMLTYVFVDNGRASFALFVYDNTV